MKLVDGYELPSSILIEREDISDSLINMLRSFIQNHFTTRRELEQLINNLDKYYRGLNPRAVLLAKIFYNYLFPLGILLIPYSYNVEDIKHALRRMYLREIRYYTWKEYPNIVMGYNVCAGGNPHFFQSSNMPILITILKNRDYWKLFSMLPQTWIRRVLEKAREDRPIIIPRELTYETLGIDRILIIFCFVGKRRSMPDVEHVGEFSLYSDNLLIRNVVSGYSRYFTYDNLLQDTIVKLILSNLYS